MKKKTIKLKAIFISALLITVFATPCNAKTLLTYFDTVFIADGEENSRQMMLENVLTEATPLTVNNTFSEEAKNNHTTLHSIIKSASGTFFQK